jgi:hypothetical protein
MCKNLVRWSALGCLVILSLVFMGCGGGGGVMLAQPQAQQVKSKTDLLLAAGFRQVFPTTPQLKARLDAMPQHQIFMASKGPKVFYVYADAAGCGCFYAGNQEQYQAFRKLAAQARLAAEEIEAAQLNESMNYSWDECGEAGPWAY